MLRGFQVLRGLSRLLLAAGGGTCLRLVPYSLGEAYIPERGELAEVVREGGGHTENA